MWLFNRKRHNSNPQSPQKLNLPINHGITLEIWQGRDEYVKWARSFYQTREGIDMLSVIRNSMPVAGKGDCARFALGKMHGYMEALAVMASLACYPPKSNEQIPVTYEPPADEPDYQDQPQ